MDNFFENSETGKNLLFELQSAFLKVGIKSGPCVYIIFVCGGSLEESENRRKNFNQYAKDNLQKFILINVEVIFKYYHRGSAGKVANLSTFESLIANLSDCILIFPESAGSFTELGYFSNSKKLLDKILVVNDKEFSEAHSFISEGPLRMINKKSKFEKILWIEKEEGVWDFSRVKTYLDERFIQKKNSKILGSFLEKKPKEQIFIVLEIIELFGWINMKTINYICFTLFGAGDYLKKIKLYLAVLEDLGMIQPHSESSDYYQIKDISPFKLSLYKKNENVLKLLIRNVYETTGSHVEHLFREVT